MNKSKKIIILSIAAVIVILSFGFLIKFTIRASLDPVDTVFAFSDSFNDERYEKMLVYIDPSVADIIKEGQKLLPDDISRKALKVLIPFISDVANIKLYPEVVNVKEEKKRATVTVKFRNIDENNYYDIYLKKEKGYWYIKYFWVSDYDGSD